MKRPALYGGRPVRSSFLVFGQPDIREPEIQEVVKTLRSKWIGTGPKVEQFEKEFARYIGCKHALALSSCTAGLHLSLETLRVGPGDEVITTPISFVATANVIVHCGARPVFVDVDRKTMNIDPERVKNALSSRTKVILPVHMAGRPCDMDALLELREKHGLFLVEDAAHAIEAMYKNKKIGTIGDLTAFSFYATKNLVTGEGGMVTTNNDAWADEIRIKRLHGLSKDAWKRYSAEGFRHYEALYPGYKYNMTDIQASLGIHQLARIEENLKRREHIWKMYTDAFSDLPEIEIPPEENHIRHARHLFIILLNLEALTISRDEFMAALKAENIGCGIHFKAIHLHKFYREKFGYKRGDFPNAEWISDRTLSLPLSPALTDEDVHDVIEAVRKIVMWTRKK